jgi:hypothetical protein
LIVLDRHHGDIIRMTQRWEHNPILINQLWLEARAKHATSVSWPWWPCETHRK